MYNALLNRVISIIDKTADVVEPKQETYSDFYNQLFNQEIYQEELKARRKREKLKNGLIIGATSLAVVGELVHLTRKSGVVDKILKK